MANNYSGRFQVIVDTNFDNILDLSTARDRITLNDTQSFGNGSSANQAQIHWSDLRTLSAGASETLDLAALPGAPFGTASFSSVKVAYLILHTPTPNYRLEVGGNGANEALIGLKTNDVAVINAGGRILNIAPVDGYPVNSTLKLLKITNPSAGAVSYSIVLTGNGTVT